MAYVALYRKWRPKAFSDLVGQEHVSRTLAQAIESGRVGHAYLFSGPRGTGKTSTAKILAKALNCEKGPTTEPCNECESCRRVNDGTSMDVFEIDAASNRGIDEIRELRETVRFAPSSGRYKVYIIDEVHMLTCEAFNALLKTLEEPPAQVVFILATTEIHKVPATIQSRCQRYDFKRIAPKAIESRLRTVAGASGIAADDDALALIAREADGGMRDALSTLDQCASLTGERVTEQLVRDILGLVGRESILRVLRAVAARDAREALSVVAEVLAEGKDLKVLVTELIAELRAVMVYQAAGGLDGMELYETDEAALSEISPLFTPGSFMPILRRLHDALTELRWTTEPRIAVETALLTLCTGAVPVVPESSFTPVRTSPVALPSGAAMAMQTANDIRIMRIEARIAQLENTVAADRGCASTSGPTTSVEVPSGSVTLLRLGEEDDAGNPTSDTPAGNNTVKRTRSTREKAPANASIVHTAAEGADTDGIVYQVTPEGTALWERLLESLKADARSRIVHACAVNGKFGGMTGERFCVIFTSPFLVKQLTKYTAAIESLLAALSGKTFRLVTKAVKPEPKPAKKLWTQDAIPPFVEAMPPDDRSVVEQALHLLDGKIIPTPVPRTPLTGIHAEEPKGTAAPEKETFRSLHEKVEDDVPSYVDEDFARFSDDDYIPPEEPL